MLFEFQPIILSTIMLAFANCSEILSTIILIIQSTILKTLQSIILPTIITIVPSTSSIDHFVKTLARFIDSICQNKLFRQIDYVSYHLFIIKTCYKKVVRNVSNKTYHVSYHLYYSCITYK